MRIPKVIGAIAILFVALSCEKQTCECTVQHKTNVTFQLQKDGQPISLGNSFSDDSLEVVVDKLRFYISHLKFKKADNYDVPASTIEIVDLKNADLNTFEYNLDEGDYTAIEMGVGLDATQNASFPADFPVEHPLSSYYNMYWSWAAKYKFMEFQGKSSPSGDLSSGDDIPFSYHPGVDEFYKTYTIPVSFTVSESTTTVVIQMDYDTIFKGSEGDVNILTENSSHTTPADYHIAEKLIFNFGESLSASAL